MRGHVVIITETESTYVMIDSTLRYDDVEDIPGLLCFFGQFKGHVCGQENGVGDGLGTRLYRSLLLLEGVDGISENGIYGEMTDQILLAHFGSMLSLCEVVSTDGNSCIKVVI